MISTLSPAALLLGVVGQAAHAVERPRSADVRRRRLRHRVGAAGRSAISSAGSTSAASPAIERGGDRVVDRAALAVDVEPERAGAARADLAQRQPGRRPPERVLVVQTTSSPGSSGTDVLPVATFAGEAAAAQRSCSRCAVERRERRDLLGEVPRRAAGADERDAVGLVVGRGEEELVVRVGDVAGEAELLRGRVRRQR